MVEFVNDTEYPVTIAVQHLQLNGLLFIPRGAIGMVIFVHGSGSGRLSPRNQYVAKMLQHAKFATLLFDLLTTEEDEIDNQTSIYRFDIPLLTQRLLFVTRWLLSNPVLRKLPTGYFGASTGAAAALLAAAELSEIKAVVSRGGRPDLAQQHLAVVNAATLLIVGSLDTEVIHLNKIAYDELHCEKKLAIVPDASHLFEEPGKLEMVGYLAKNWFAKYLV